MMMSKAATCRLCLLLLCLCFTSTVSSTNLLASYHHTHHHSSIHSIRFGSDPGVWLRQHTGLSPVSNTTAVHHHHPAPASQQEQHGAARQLAQDTKAPQQSTSEPAQDHKPLFPISSLDIAVLVIAGIVLFIAAGAGMGGGPVLVPLYLVAGLNNTAAVALSNSTILAGSVGNTLVNVFKRHPYKNKPMIDWDLVLLMEPPTLIGAIAGSYINKLLPAWITSVLLVLLLAGMTVRVAQRAVRIYTRESAAKQEDAAPATGAFAAPGAPKDVQAGVNMQQQQSAHEQGSLPSSSTLNGRLHTAAPERQQLAASASSRHDESRCSNGEAAAAPAGVKQLLAEERAAHVGPSDLPSPVQQQQPLYNRSSIPSSSSSATTHAPASALHAPHGARQQPQQQQHRRAHEHPGRRSAAGHTCPASAPASPFRRPSSPAGDGTPGSGAAAMQPAGERSPFRGTLSTVPSSVLLSVELEGGMSEAALQRLAMLEMNSRRFSEGLDAADASLASMYGLTGPQWQQHEQQRHTAGSVARMAQQQAQREPPSEAECRLAYAPPDHSRRDSWELAWEEELQEVDAGSGGADTRGLSPSDASGASRQQRLTATPNGTTTTGVAAAAASRPTVLASTPPAAATAAATAAAPLAASPASTVEMASRTRWPAATSEPGGVPLPTQDTHAAGAGAAAPRGLSGTTGITTAAAAGPSRYSDSALTAVTSSFPGGSSNRQGRKAPEVAAAARAEAIERMLAAEAVQLPFVPVALLLVMFAAVLLTSLFSKMAPCGSAVFWVVQCSVVPALLGVWLFSRRRVLAKVALKKAAQLDFHGEVRWTPRKSLVFPIICSLAGIIAGMFGLGGAVVKTPLMLELGVHPSVTAATTQTMLLLTSSASSIVYAQLGDIPWDWATVMLPMAFAATLAGQAAIDWLVKKVGRSSMVVLVLAAFFIVATCLSVYTMAGAAQAVAHNPSLVGKFGKICR